MNESKIEINHSTATETRGNSRVNFAYINVFSKDNITIARKAGKTLARRKISSNTEGFRAPSALSF